MPKDKMTKLSFENTEIAFQSKSTQQLKKSYWLFKLVSNKALVKISPTLLKIAFFLRLPIKGLIKQTIFEQFCGGESIDTCDKRIQTLAKYNIGTILDYSVEGMESEVDFNRVTQETIRTILKAKKDKNIPFAVFKTSGLARIDLLEKVGTMNDELSKEEKEEINSPTLNRTVIMPMLTFLKFQMGQSFSLTPWKSRKNWMKQTKNC
jgi:proline dehydrogenase